MRMFESLEAFCMFVGYPQSGHSLVGSMLDAHPDMIIAHEADALKAIQEGTDRDPLFKLLLSGSKGFTAKGRKWTGYDYSIPNQWNGRHRNLRIIGDKKGAGSSDKILMDPTLVEKLRTVVNLPIKVVHVTRNPFDIVSTWNRRVDRPLDKGVKLFYKRAKGVETARNLFDDSDWIDIRHEDVILRPKESLERLVTFLGQDPDPAYLSDCASVVFGAPNESRFKVDWSDELKDRFARGLKDYPWFESYDFEASLVDNH